VQSKSILHRGRRSRAAERNDLTAAVPQPYAGRSQVDDVPAATPAPVEALPGHGFLGRLAADLAEMLCVERVTVAIADPDHADAGIVAACVGAPGVLGRHAPLPTERATGVKSAAEAAALGLGADGDHELPWSYAHVPIAGTCEVLGAVTVVSRRARAFTEQDLIFVERIARRRVPEFDRRRRGRVPRATV
jgi:hypothetical protein